MCTFSVKKQYGFHETSYSPSRVTEASLVATAAAHASSCVSYFAGGLLLVASGQNILMFGDN